MCNYIYGSKIFNIKRHIPVNQKKSRNQKNNTSFYTEHVGHFHANQFIKVRDGIWIGFLCASWWSRKHRWRTATCGNCMSLCRVNLSGLQRHQQKKNIWKQVKCAQLCRHASWNRESIQLHTKRKEHVQKLNLKARSIPKTDELKDLYFVSPKQLAWNDKFFKLKWVKLIAITIKPQCYLQM